MKRPIPHPLTASQLQSSDALRETVRQALSAQGEEREENIAMLAPTYLRVAELGNAEWLQIFLEEGFPVNTQDPETEETALHVVAARSARQALRVLMKWPELDYLIRDNQGRLASELAFAYGRNPAMSRLLGIKEHKQADELGIELTWRP